MNGSAILRAAPAPVADLAGRLRVAPGSARPLACERPVLTAGLLDRLTLGRRAALLPELLASLFTLCGAAHRATARRALQAACSGAAVAPSAEEAQAHRLATLREHLQRLALDLPVAAGVRRADAVELAALRPLLLAPAEALPALAERHWLGLPGADWWAAWSAGGAHWLAAWVTAQVTAAAGSEPAHPGRAFWSALADLVPRARALRWPCRTLHLGEADWPALASALNGPAASQAEGDAPLPFAAAPSWQGEPAETGAWTRLPAAAALPADGRTSAWDRIAARVAEAVALLQGATLPAGALALGPGDGLAWTEMSRGLLVHRVRLQPHADGRFDAQCRVAACQVLAPTEWNFHPQGGLAQRLASATQRGSMGAGAVVACEAGAAAVTGPAMGAAMPAATVAPKAGALCPADLGLMIAALDPCVPFDLVAAQEPTDA